MLERVQNKTQTRANNLADYSHTMKPNFFLQEANWRLGKCSTLSEGLCGLLRNWNKK